MSSGFRSKPAHYRRDYHHSDRGNQQQVNAPERPVQADRLHQACAPVEEEPLGTGDEPPQPDRSDRGQHADDYGHDHRACRLGSLNPAPQAFSEISNHWSGGMIDSTTGGLRGRSNRRDGWKRVEFCPLDHHHVRVKLDA